MRGTEEGTGLGGEVYLFFTDDLFESVDEFGGGVDVVDGFGVEEDFFTVVAADAEVKGNGALVLADKGFDAGKGFAGGVVFV